MDYKIKNKSFRILSINGVEIVPGLCRFVKADFDKVLSHPHAQIKIKRGILEVVGAKVEEVVEIEDKEPALVSANTVKELLPLIKASDDVDYLQGIKDSDDRTTVIQAVDARLAELKGDDDEQSESGDDETENPAV